MSLDYWWDIVLIQVLEGNGRSSLFLKGSSINYFDHIEYAAYYCYYDYYLLTIIITLDDIVVVVVVIASYLCGGDLNNKVGVPTSLLFCEKISHLITYNIRLMDLLYAAKMLQNRKKKKSS